MAERRPIATRNSRWAAAAARSLARSRITPNMISQASVVFAALAGLAFWISARTGATASALLLITGALFCQLRLLCNLFDGMVAVEGGQAAPDGPFWNEAPDRFADIAILVGAGLALDQPTLGFAAATAAVLTAYIRELGRSEGAPVDFSGPMAKPQRMAAITLGAVLGAGEIITTGSQWALTLALWAVALGASFTALRRSARLIAHLKTRV